MSNLSEITYIALGDSLTEGIGADSILSHWTSKYFNNIKQSEKCSFRNLGVSGLTSSDLLELINTPALKRLLPRATHLSITTGGCDFIELYENNGFNPSKFFDKMNHVRDETEKILKKVRDLNPKSHLFVLGFYIPVPAYKYGVDTASIMVKTMNNYYKEICAEYNVELINPFDHFLERYDYFIDEVHPNQVGYDVLSELILSSHK